MSLARIARSPASHHSLLTVWWEALNAPTRHYIKRRVGKICTKKLVLKVLDIASAQVAEDLERVQVEADFDAVVQALLSAAPGWAEDRLRSSLSQGGCSFQKLGMAPERPEDEEAGLWRQHPLSR